jgi:hypothetical protein
MNILNSIILKMLLSDQKGHVLGLLEINYRNSSVHVFSILEVGKIVNLEWLFRMLLKQVELCFFSKLLEYEHKEQKFFVNQS